MSRPLILVCNDDGISARGIQTLREGLEDVGEVYVVAPDGERSAMSHALTLGRPLRVRQVEERQWAVDGTPADCIYLGLLQLLPRAPDLVASGCNHGLNLGVDVFYSGTVAAAVEAAIRDIASFAISLEPGPDEGFDRAAEFAREFARSLLARQAGPGLPPKTVFNVNVPNRGALEGFSWTRMGERIYRDAVDIRTDPRGRHYYWIGGPAADLTDVAGSDGVAISRRLVSVTPLHLDLTGGELDELAGSWQVPGWTRQDRHDS